MATKNSYSNARVLQFYAEELGGNDFVSFNIFLTKKKPLLKPCEMSAKKVIDFILQFR